MDARIGLLAQTTGTGALDVSTSVGIGVLVLALAGAALMGWLHVSTRPSRVRSAGATMDLRNETPAIVDLLTGGFEVEDDAMPATVVDLAARGWFTIEDIGNDRIVLRLRQREPDDELTSYEERVMRHIRKHATDGIVPAPVLTLGPEGVSERWFKGFRREVTAHGRSLGLCHRRWDLKHIVLAWVAVAVAGAPAGIVASGADRTSDPTGWGTVGNLLVGVAFVIALGLAWYAQKVTRADAQIDTPEGLEAAAHWEGVRKFFGDNGRFEDKPAPSVAIWDRNLAYATALGLAPLVQRQIPFETEHDRTAWSLVTGHWRRVKVSYAARVPGWGQAPWTVALTGLIRGAVAAVLAYAGFWVASNTVEIDAVTISDDQRRIIGLVGLVVAVAMSVAAAWSLLRVVLGVSDLFPRRITEGELVRRRELPTGHWLPNPVQWVLARRSDRRYGHDRSGIRLGPNQRDRRRRRYYLAVDDGTSERIRAFRVRRQIHDQVAQGATIRVKHSPRLGYVTEVTTLAPPRASAADEGAEAHPLAAETVDRALSGLGRMMGGAGGLQAAMERMESTTGEDGRPVLDQTDDEGVTLRQRLADSQGQVDALRDDPRVARTPLLGQILDTLTGDGSRDEPHGHRDDPDPSDTDRADDPGRSG
ncbi:MAG: hypothetical protein WD225_11500 [Ilumatobacteraceae bacterium]